MKDKSKHQSVLILNGYDARQFFLKSESYCNIDLPPYYTFQNILDETSRIYYDYYLQEKPLKSYTNTKKVKELSDVNYHIYANKDGNLSWREFQVIHPLLYIHLVYTLTQRDNWSNIVNRFSTFKKNRQIQCLSIPVLSLTEESDKAEQVSNWWQNVEQRSIELALEYDYLYDTDIADCYSSIYTHSLAWAVEGKNVAKKNMHDKELLGNQVDTIIQMMQQGQTNGIPQGSTLMDFIAEILLGYIDEQLSKKIEIEGISDYRIIRYRDDYRIFVNNPDEGSTLLKILSKELLEVGMRLNSAKTKESNDVITTAIKADKIDWLNTTILNKNAQQLILAIREHSKKYPDSGSLKKELRKYYYKINKKYVHPNSILSLVSIVTDICYKNPNTYPISFAIISKLLNLVSDKDRKNYIVDAIFKKFEQLPNTGFMQIWFKRMIRDSRNDIKLDEELCTILNSQKSLWDNSWINPKPLKEVLENTPIVNIEKYYSLDDIIQSNEFSLFEYHEKK